MHLSILRPKKFTRLRRAAFFKLMPQLPVFYHGPTPSFVNGAKDPVSSSSLHVPPNACGSPAGAGGNGDWGNGDGREGDG